MCRTMLLNGNSFSGPAPAWLEARIKTPNGRITNVAGNCFTFSNDPAFTSVKAQQRTVC